MSLETWKQEFYPVPADSPEATETELAAVKHSLRKWEGLRFENREKHGVVQDLTDLRRYEDEKGKFFYAEGSTCALCRRHKGNCGNCIIEAFDIACDYNLSAYTAATETSDNPEPMIILLRVLVKVLEGAKP